MAATQSMRMSQEANSIGWTVTVEINDGEEDNVRALVDEAIEIAKKEPATCLYEFFLDDKGSLTIRERFTGQQGAIDHLKGPAAQEVTPKLLGKSTLGAFVVYGTPNPELAKMLEAFPVRYGGQLIGGFCRLAGADTATSELVSR